MISRLYSFFKKSGPGRLLEQWYRVFWPEAEALGINDLLSRFSPSDDLPERMESVRRLMTWFLMGGEAQVNIRFRFFFRAVDTHPEWREQLVEVLNSVVRECDFFLFFTEVGMTVEHGLWGDLARRFFSKLVVSGQRRDFFHIFVEASGAAEAREALHAVAAENILEMYRRVEKWLSPEAEEKLREGLKNAEFYLATHVAHYGLSSSIQRRVDDPNHVEASPFFRITEAVRNGKGAEIEPVIHQCENEIKTVYAHLEESGVSVDVVNRLETLESLLRRLRRIARLREKLADEEAAEIIHRLLRAVADAGEGGRSMSEVLRRHFYLLTRKIAERNGHSGEHYIARNSGEMKSIFYSAVGGGAIVVVMTIFKIMLLHRAPAPFFTATGLWIIYSAGFLAMQFTGAQLATKIPSFTAARLAAFLKSARRMDLKGFRQEVRQVVKSQSTSLIGNLCGVIPFALAFNWALKRTVWNEGFLDTGYAWHVIHNLHPIFSFTIAWGALTGLQLWLSSLAGGWFENWLVFNGIPEAVREHYRLRKVLGEERAAQAADTLMNHSSGVATNVALGFLFGFTPLLGQIFGIDLSGHHVTIATTSAMFAISSLHFALPWQDWVAFPIGLLLVGMLNFGVSFAAALFVAASSRRMQFRRMLYYLRTSFRN